MIEAQHSVEEYLNTSYEPDMEFADGELIARNVGAPTHSLLQVIIGTYFHNLRKAYPRLMVLPAARLKISPQRYRIPDVMILEFPCIPGRFVTDVPAVVIEILSPEDRFGQFLAKCREYLAFNILNIIVIDPDARRTYRFGASGLLYDSVPVLRFPKSAIELPFPVHEMFAEIDADLSWED